jgi:hypothetical protein
MSEKQIKDWQNMENIRFQQEVENGGDGGVSVGDGKS